MDLSDFLGGFLDESKKKPAGTSLGDQAKRAAGAIIPVANMPTHTLKVIGSDIAHVPADVAGFLGDFITEGGKAVNAVKQKLENNASPDLRDVHFPGYGAASQAAQAATDKIVPRVKPLNKAEDIAGQGAEGIAALASGSGAGLKTVARGVGMVAGSHLGDLLPADANPHLKEAAGFLGGFLGAGAPDAVEHTAQKFGMPVEGKITSPFGAREAPKAGASTNHMGVDIAVPVGTPVRAPADGVVEAVGHGDSKRGNWVELKHPDGTTSRYFHLSEFDVKPGDDVAQGDTFAKSGATGNVTGPHLHWSVIDADGHPVDPMTFKGHVVESSEAPTSKAPEATSEGLPPENSDAPEVVDGEVVPPEPKDASNVVNLDDVRQGRTNANWTDDSERVLNSAHDLEDSVAQGLPKFNQDQVAAMHDQLSKGLEVYGDGMPDAAKENYSRALEIFKGVHESLNDATASKPIVDAYRANTAATPDNGKYAANENLGSTAEAPGGSGGETPPPPPGGGGDDGNGPVGGGGTGLPPGEDAQKYAASINLNRLYISEEAKDKIKNMAQAMDTDVQTHEENKAAAMDLINKKGYEKILAAKKVDIEELPAHATAVRAIHAAAQDNVVRLAGQREQTPIGEIEDFDTRFKHALGVAADAFQRDNQIAKIQGRGLSARRINIGGNKDLSNTLHHILGADDLEAIAKNINEFQTQAGEISFDAKIMGRYVSSYYYDIDMLSRVTTQVVNVVGNYIVNAFEDMATLLAATISTPQRMITGKGVSFQEFAARLEGHKVGQRNAFSKGFNPVTGEMTDAPVVDAYKKSMPADYAGRTEEYNMFKGKLGILGTAGKLLAAEDEYFRNFGAYADLYAKATRLAYNKGLRGQELIDYRNELVQKPTQGMVKSAQEFGKMSRLQDAPTPMGKALQQITHSRYMPLAMAGKLVMPFVRMMDRSMMLSMRAIPGVSFSDRITRGDWQSGAEGRYIAASRQLIGAAGILMVAKLAMNGEVTGTGPSDPTQRPEWLHSHKMMSFKVGGHWISYARLPFAGLIAGTATGVERFQETKGKDWSTVVASSAVGLAHGLATEGWASGLSDFFDNFQDTKGGMTQLARFLGKTLADVIVPGMVQETNKWVDPNYRDTNDHNTFGGVVAGQIKEATPGLSETLPERYDVYGQPIKREGGAWNLINPLSFQSVPQDFSPQMDRLTADTGQAAVTPAPRTVNIGGQKTKLDAQGYQEYQKRSGRYFMENMNPVMQSWSGMSTDERQKAVKGALKEARERARGELGFDTPQHSSGGSDYGMDLGNSYGFSPGDFQ